MRRLTFLWMISFFGLLSTYGQTNSSISGKIRDQKSNPVASASVHLLNTNFGAITGTHGAFAIKNVPDGKYFLQVSAVGFASVSQAITVGINVSDEIIVQLNEAIGQLDEVIVSAQKKEEDLQKVPFSVSSLNSRQVQEYRLWYTADITAIIPNLYSAHSGDNRTVTSIRGIGTTSYDQAVATYVDGVSQFNLDTYIPQLLDVERIEVLRGPQGTLYGRNAMAGVINIITRQPSNYTNGFAEISVGNYAQQRYTMGFRSPVISNKLFAGAALQYESRNGYYTNQFTNSDFDKQNQTTGNYYLKWLATDKLAVTLNVKHHNNRNKGPFPLAIGKEAALDEPFVVNQNAVTTMQDDIFNTSLSLNYAGSGFNFTSLTAYQSNLRVYKKPIDGDFSPLDAVTIINNYGENGNKVKAWTQEFKFATPARSVAKLKWTAGSYLFYQDNPVKQATHFGNDAPLIGIPGSNFSVITTNNGESYGIALYGQGTYSVNEKVDITFGMRYDYEKRKLGVVGEYQQDGDPAFVVRPDTSASDSYSAFSPKLGIAYHISDNNQVYASYSRGYRAGGLTQLSSDPSQPPLFSYKPEYSANYEVGIKNDFLEKRLRLNVAAFYTIVNDAQVPTLILPDAITVVRNAGKLTSKGGELEVSATPVKGLELQYNLGINDAQYETLKLSQNGQEVNLDGNKQIFTPNTTSMLMAQFTRGLGSQQKLKLILRGEWFYLGKQYFDLANTISQEAYSLFNARAGVSTRHADLFIWGRNLGDKKYIAYAYDFGGVHLGNPQTYGATILLKL